MKKIKKILIGLIACITILTAEGPLLNVQAASWTENASQDIYTKGGQEKANKDDTESPEPSKFEKFLAGAINGLATGVNSFFGDVGVSLDSIICGRVGSGGADTALFTFEFKRGNPYGLMSAIIYNLLRKIVFVLMAVVLSMLFAKAMWSKSGVARQSSKSTLMTFGLAYALLFLMPYLLDLFLYLRDQILYALLSSVNSSLGSITGTETHSVSIISNFQTVALKSQRLIDALMYLAAVCVTLFFAFEYAGMAMAMVLLVILFPFMCIKQNFSSSSISSWCLDVFSVTMTPILDFTLLMIPVFISAITARDGNESWMLELMLCLMIIPSRNVAKRILGLTSTGAGIANGLMALGAIKAAQSMGRRGANRLSKISENLKNARADGKNAKYHSDMANLEKSSSDSVMEEHGYQNIANANARNNENKKYGISEPNGETINKKKKSTGGFGIGEKESGKTKKNGSSTKDAKYATNKEFGETGYSVKGNQTHAGFASENEESETIAERIEDLGKKKKELKNGIAGERLNIAHAEKEISRLEGKNALLEQDAIDSGDRRKNDTLIAKNKTAIAAQKFGIKDAKTKIAQAENEVGAIDNQISDLQSVAGSHGSRGRTMEFDQRAQEIASKYATVDNFEQPQFANLSHADKARLYKKRATQQLAKGAISAGAITTEAIAGGMLGGIGGAVAAGALSATGSAAGAVLGGAATMMYGPSTAIMGASIGSGIVGAPVNAASYIIGEVLGRQTVSHSAPQRYAKAPSMVIRQATEIVPNATSGLSNYENPYSSGGFMVYPAPPPTPLSGGSQPMALSAAPASIGLPVETVFAQTVPHNGEVLRVEDFQARYTGAAAEVAHAASQRLNAVATNPDMRRQFAIDISKRLVTQNRTGMNIADKKADVLSEVLEMQVEFIENAASQKGVSVPDEIKSNFQRTISPKLQEMIDAVAKDYEGLMKSIREAEED